MSIRIAVILSYVVIVGLGFYLFISAVVEELEPRYRESVEESLVDTATIFAGVLGEEIRARGPVQRSHLEAIFTDIYARQLEAVIYDVVKTSVDLRVYVTDEKGVVRFHSHTPSMVGADYSKWNDVHLSLQGRYGARSTSDDPEGKGPSVLHVAAPILVNGQIAGVVTVAKPTDSINAFMSRARQRLVLGGGILAFVIIFAGMAVTYWLTQPIGRLTGYARAVRDGRREAPPRPGGAREIRELGAAFEEMREALEGKTYVENYVQGLTHEIKSPLAAIQGASELLAEEDIPPERRRKFTSNIQKEVRRLTDLVDRLLRLAGLEARKELADPEAVDLAAVVEEAVACLRPVAEARKLRLRFEIDDLPAVWGERFLLLQAVDNLVQNALDFTPSGGEITVALQRSGNEAELSVRDTGSGVPDYALDRVFERFYSLARPETGAKSTGLGLAYVREIAELHQGTIRLENHRDGGAVATLRIPFIQSESA